ncbi:MAG: HAD hydrolase-like protein, partial [Nanoarchaeota archaeon]|nr:HAD hydrolase-like protein [Nanoarchaeota archaeon]
VDKEKPHPEVLFKVLKHFKAKDAWVVEDSETGLETVKAAGLRTILFRHGFNKDLNADYIINDFSELTSIVD